MKNGFGLVALLIAGGLLVVISASIAAASALTQKSDRKIVDLKFRELANNNSGQLEKERPQLVDDLGVPAKATPTPPPVGEAASSPASAGGLSTNSGSADSSGTIYKQPQDLY